RHAAFPAVQVKRNRKLAKIVTCQLLAAAQPGQSLKPDPLERAERLRRAAVRARDKDRGEVRAERIFPHPSAARDVRELLVIAAARPEFTLAAFSFMIHVHPAVLIQFDQILLDKTAAL